MFCNGFHLHVICQAPVTPWPFDIKYLFATVSSARRRPVMPSRAASSLLRHGVCIWILVALVNRDLLKKIMTVVYIEEKTLRR